jgi:hypothetical protein
VVLKEIVPLACEIATGAGGEPALSCLVTLQVGLQQVMAYKSLVSFVKLYLLLGINTVTSH